MTTSEPPVRFKQPLNDLEVWEQDLAILECEVPEDSVPITWYLEDRRLQPGAKYGMEEWGTKRRLTIRDMGVDDDGIYLCEMPDGGRSIAEVTVKGKYLRTIFKAGIQYNTKHLNLKRFYTLIYTFATSA